MTMHTCPKSIYSKFRSKDESKRALARAEAVDWAASLDLVPGDTVRLPNPDTGKLEWFVVDKSAALSAS